MLPIDDSVFFLYPVNIYIYIGSMQCIQNKVYFGEWGGHIYRDLKV